LVSLCSQFLPALAAAADGGVPNRLIVQALPPVSPQQAVAYAATNIVRAIRVRADFWYPSLQSAKNTPLVSPDSDRARGSLSGFSKRTRTDYLRRRRKNSLAGPRALVTTH
jgi:hypothetical protein